MFKVRLVGLAVVFELFVDAGRDELLSGHAELFSVILAEPDIVFLFVTEVIVVLVLASILSNDWVFGGVLPAVSFLCIHCKAVHNEINDQLVDFVFL